MLKIIEMAAWLTGFAGFSLMANDVPHSTLAIMDFDGFPEYNIYGLLIVLVSVLIGIAANKRRSCNC